MKKRQYLSFDDLVRVERPPLNEYTGKANLNELARMLDVSPRAVHGWAARGVPRRTAELLCDARGMHPTEVWGDAYYQED